MTRPVGFLRPFAVVSGAHRRGGFMSARLSRQVFGAVSLALLSSMNEASASGAGVVTGVSGQVTVSRTEASPLPLRFKDEVFLKDRISTPEHSLARLLLDHKAFITVRELSVRGNT